MKLSMHVKDWTERGSCYLRYEEQQMGQQGNGLNTLFSFY